MSTILQGHFAVTPEGIELTLRRGKVADTVLLDDLGALLAYLAREFAAPVRPDPTTPPSGTSTEDAERRAA